VLFPVHSEMGFDDLLDRSRQGSTGFLRHELASLRRGWVTTEGSSRPSEPPSRGGRVEGTSGPAKFVHRLAPPEKPNLSDAFGAE
jgi:hypothetical protein